MSDDARALDGAEALLALGRHEDALRDAGAVLARDPASADARRIVGEALLELERWDDLAEVAREAVASFPEDAWAWRLQALVQTERRARDDALEAAARLRILAPDSVSTTYAYAQVLRSFGLAEQALPVVEAALLVHPDVVDLHLARAQCLWKIGRSRDAREAVRTALRIDPDDEDARLLLEVFGDPRRRSTDALIDVARRTARRPGDGGNEVLFELASSRVLSFPSLIALGLCVLALAICPPTGGLFGWRIDTGGDRLIGATAQAVLWIASAIIIGVWLRRVRFDLGELFSAVVSSRIGDGPLSTFASAGIAGALLLNLIGVVLYATVGDPVGPLVLVLALSSAYAAAVLVLLFRLLPTNRVTSAMVRPAALLFFLWPGLVAGVVLVALYIVGAVVYILIWSFSGDRLPEPFPSRDGSRSEKDRP